MTNDDLRVMEDDLKAITPGPWAVEETSWDGDDVLMITSGGVSIEDIVLDDDPKRAEQQRRDVAFIAAAPGRIATLLDEVRFQNKLLADKIAIDSPQVAELIRRVAEAERRRARRSLMGEGWKPMSEAEWEE